MKSQLSAEFTKLKLLAWMKKQTVATTATSAKVVKVAIA